MEDDYDNPDEINVTEFETYSDFLATLVTADDRFYLEDEELAKSVKDLYSVNKGEIKSRKDFENRKREIEELNKVDDNKEKPLASEGKTFEPDSFLWHLQQREYEVRNGRKSTIIFIRYIDSNYKDISAYIDYRERLKTENFEDIFNRKKDLVPKPTDLSYHNWTIQKTSSMDSTFFRVDAGHKEKLSFRNNTDRKIINVDLDYLKKHPNLDVKRIPIKLEVDEDEETLEMIITVIEKEIKEEEKMDKLKKKQVVVEKGQMTGYQQIVIFDYETSSK